METGAGAGMGYRGAKRNPQLLRELLDRLEGKVTQPIGGDREKPLQFEVVDKETRQALEQYLDSEG